MAQRAQITSVEAIESFRAKLIVYLSKVRASTEEVGDEIRHTRAWLESDRRTFWEQECRRRQRALDEAQQELFNARISRIVTQSAAQLLAVERAKSALRQAEDKRDRVRRWIREFENRADPLGKQVERLLTLVVTDLPKATAHLGNILKALEAYAALASDHGSPVKGDPGTPAKEEDHLESQSPATLTSTSTNKTEASPA